MEILDQREGRLAALVTRLLQCLLRNKTHEEFWAEVVAEWRLLGAKLTVPDKKGKIRNGERAEWEKKLNDRLAELRALPFLELMENLAVSRTAKQKWHAILAAELEAEKGRTPLVLFQAFGLERAVFFERCTNPHEVPRVDKHKLRAHLETLRLAIKATDLTPQSVIHGMLQDAEEEVAFMAARRGWTWGRILGELLPPHMENILSRVPNLEEVYNPPVCAKVAAAAPKAVAAFDFTAETTYAEFNRAHRARQMGALKKFEPKAAVTMRETLLILLEKLPNARGCVERAMSLEGPLTAGQILSAIIEQMGLEKMPAGDVAEARRMFGMVEDQDGYVVSVVFPSDFAGFVKLVSPFFDDSQLAEVAEFVGTAAAALEMMKKLCGKKDLLDNMFQRVDPAEMVLPAPKTFVGFATAVMKLAAEVGKVAELEALTLEFSGSGKEYADAVKKVLCAEHVARLYACVSDEVMLK
jgi:hypothetical protein